MTAILSLVQREDFIADQSTLNLLDFSNGWALTDNGWEQATPADGDTSLIETMILAVRGVSHDDLAANVRALDLKIKQVYDYHDPQQLYGIWLRCRLLNETNTRQALLVGARRSQFPIWAGETRNPSGGYYYVAQYTVALERMPLWESIADTVLGTWSVSALGGRQDYGTAAGDQPARLAAVNATNPGAGAISNGMIWCGFRSNRYGNRANFQSTWSLRKSIDLVGGTTGGTSNADADTKDGFKTITDFGAGLDALARRVTIRVTDVTANDTDQRGTFLVLLRAKLSAAGTVNVRLANGLYGYSPPFGALMAVGSRVAITNTAWNLYEMGVVNLPPTGRLLGGAYNMTNCAMGVDAELISGTPKLHMDCLVLIPISEGWWTTSTMPVLPLLGSNIALLQSASGQAQASYQDPSTVPPTNLAPAAARISQGLPAGAGILVLAGADGDTTYQQANGTLSISLDIYPRWTTLRGSA